MKPKEINDCALETVTGGVTPEELAAHAAERSEKLKEMANPSDDIDDGMKKWELAKEESEITKDAARDSAFSDIQKSSTGSVISTLPGILLNRT